MGAPTRYEFLSTMLTLHTNLPTALANDPFWTVISNTYSSGANGVLGRNVLLKNKKKANMVITMAMIQGYGYNIRWGLRQPANEAQPTADAWLAYPISATPPAVSRYATETPSMTGTTSQFETFKFVVFTNEDYMYIHGIPQTPATIPSAHTIQIFMGTCTPYSAEDPSIANDFYGVFTHMPVSDNNSTISISNLYRYGTGIVSKARNGDNYPIYRFVTSSNLVSPSINGDYYLSPFYVFTLNEGVRGEMTGIRTAVLKDGSVNPDGSILEIGADRYYVFHVPNIQTTTSNYCLWYTSLQSGRYSSPYFFDSQLISGGQRVLLFKI